MRCFDPSSPRAPGRAHAIAWATPTDAVIAILKENGEPSVATLGRMKPRAAGAEQVDIKGAAVWGWPEPPAAK